MAPVSRDAPLAAEDDQWWVLLTGRPAPGTNGFRGHCRGQTDTKRKADRERWVWGYEANRPLVAGKRATQSADASRRVATPSMFILIGKLKGLRARGQGLVSPCFVSTLYSLEAFFLFGAILVGL